MSNDPPPVSGAPYIIICSSRADIAAAKGAEDKALAACRGAGAFCAYMGIRYRVSMKPADMKPISNLQHQLMAYIEGDLKLKKDEVEGKIAQLVVEFYELETKYTGVAY